jgi:thiol-disulfide isomerase/thioredoxin
MITALLALALVSAPEPGDPWKPSTSVGVRTPAFASNVFGIASLLLAPAGGERPYPLMLGDPAPPLSVAKWVKGSPVALEKGKVEVVEFWATWCGPCRESIPHLTELQHRYAGKVSFAGVSVWEVEPEKVEPFVAKMGEKMDYAVAMDDVEPPPGGKANDSRWALDHGKCSVAWLKASGWAESGIPCAFVVDRDGKIAWAGDAIDLDGPVAKIPFEEPLAKIVAGTWDLAKESAAYRDRMVGVAKGRELSAKLDAAQKAKDWPAVVAACDALLAFDAKQFSNAAAVKFQTLLLRMREPEKAYAWGREAIAGAAKDDAGALNRIAYPIVDPTSRVDEPDLDLATKAAERADQLAGGKGPYVKQTLARIAFVKGDVDRAIALQQTAVDLAEDDDAKASFRDILAIYRKAKAGGD